MVFLIWVDSDLTVVRDDADMLEYADPEYLELPIFYLGRRDSG